MTLGKVSHLSELSFLTGPKYRFILSSKKKTKQNKNLSLCSGPGPGLEEGAREWLDGYTAPSPGLVGH